MSEAPELLPGAVRPLRVTLRGHGRYTIARSGLRLELTAPRGLALRQRRYQRTDAIEADAADPSFSIPVRAEAAGSYSLELRLRFWACTPRSCHPVDEKRTISVEVREPPPPPAPAAAAVPTPAIGKPAAPSSPSAKPPASRPPAAKRPPGAKPPAPAATP